VTWIGSSCTSVPNIKITDRQTVWRTDRHAHTQPIDCSTWPLMWSVIMSGNLKWSSKRKKLQCLSYRPLCYFLQINLIQFCFLADCAFVCPWNSRNLFPVVSFPATLNFEHWLSNWLRWCQGEQHATRVFISNVISFKSHRSKQTDTWTADRMLDL